MLDVKSETFVMHMAIREPKEMPVHFKKQAQIKAQVKVLLFNKTFTEVLAEYSSYNDDFSVENAAEFLEYAGMNKYAIELKEGKQPLFSPIYSLGPVELEILKTYIKTTLANSFIRLSKSPAKASILFDRKSDGSLYLCMNY